MYFILSIYIYFEYIWAKYNSQLFVPKKCQMRFNVFLNIDKHPFGNRLPFKYQYELSAVIYKILGHAGREFSQWLHDNGFAADKNSLGFGMIETTKENNKQEN